MGEIAEENHKKSALSTMGCLTQTQAKAAERWQCLDRLIINRYLGFLKQIAQGPDRSGNSHNIGAKKLKLSTTHIQRATNTHLIKNAPSAPRI